MAEEKVDGLEGLDDFGDDFGEQLDSFMDNDEEEEGDSELDSFFEDLSTIDDLESDDDNEAVEETKEEIKNDEVKSDHEDLEDHEDHEDLDDDFDIEDEEESKEDNSSNTKKEKKKGLIRPLIFSIIAGSLLGVTTIVLLNIFAIHTEKALPETVLEISKELLPAVKVSKANSNNPAPKAKPKAKPNTIWYYVQVVSCISQISKNVSKVLLNLSFSDHSKSCR